MPVDRPKLSARNTFDDAPHAERLARRRLPRTLFEALTTGNDEGLTYRDNVRAFGEVAFRPRAAVSHEERDVRTTVLGTEIAFPVLAAPTGGIRVVHPRGELAVARAAGLAGTICVVSQIAGYSIEEIAAVAEGPLWQQLYLSRGRATAEEVIARAAGAGCAALVATVDLGASPVSAFSTALRALNWDVGTAVRFAPEVVRRPGWLLRFLRDTKAMEAANAALPSAGTSAQYGLNWEDLGWIREQWSGPLVVKGVLSAGDARRAVAEGAAAIVVSNHGGRGLDGLPGTLRVLPEIVAAVDGAAEVLLDGGIRRGSDVVKAISLGARAVLAGQAVVMGLAVGGEAGVARIFDIFRHDTDRTLGLLGCPSIGELDGSYTRLPLDWGVWRSGSAVSP